MNNRDVGDRNKDDKVYTQKQLSSLTIKGLKGIIERRCITTIDVNVKHSKKKSDYIDTILQHQKENSSNSSNNGGVVRYSLPTILVLKILGYCIIEGDAKQVLPYTLLSKHLHQMLKPIVMSNVTLMIGYCINYIKTRPPPYYLYSIKTDYHVITSLYEYSTKHEECKDLFVTLHHITIHHQYNSPLDETIIHLQQLIINTPTITSIDIIDSNVPKFDLELINIPNLQHLTILNQNSLSVWEDRILRGQGVCDSLQSLKLPGVLFTVKISELMATKIKLTTLTLVITPSSYGGYTIPTLPPTITNLKIIISKTTNYISSYNSKLIKWILKQTSVQYLTIRDIDITPNLAQLLKMPDLKSMIIVDRKRIDKYQNNDVDDGYIVNKQNFTKWYQEFYLGVRDAYILHNATTHVVIRDFSLIITSIIQYEHLGGIHIALNHEGYRANIIDNLKTLVLDRDEEWIEKNKKKLQKVQLPSQVIEKIVQYSSLHGLTKLARLNRSTFEYIRSSYRFKNEVKGDDDNLQALRSQYSIMNSNNIQSIVLSLSQLENIINHNNNNNINNNEFQNLQQLELKLNNNDRVPNETLQVMTKLKKLIITFPRFIFSQGEEEEMDNYFDINAQLKEYVAIKVLYKTNLDKIYKMNQEQVVHPTLKLVLNGGSISTQHLMSLPSVTHITVDNPMFMKSVSLLANLKHITLPKQDQFETIKKIVSNYLVKNQYQQLESIKIILTEMYSVKYAKNIYKAMSKLSLIRSLKSVKFVPCNTDTQDIPTLMRDIDYSPFQILNGKTRNIKFIKLN